MSLMQSLKRIFTPSPTHNNGTVQEVATDDLIKSDIDRKHRELQRRLDAQVEVQRREPK